MQYDDTSLAMGDCCVVLECCANLHTTPSNLPNGLGHSSRQYMNTHTANGLTATTPSGQHSQPPGSQTGSPL